ncbi:MAG: hypothetical protein ACR2HC_07105 [Thermoleophilaceae bacterium]
MILLLRALSRAVAFALLIVAALACLAAALFSIPPGDSGITQLGKLTHTREAADRSGRFLDRLEAGDVPANAAAGAGIAAVVGLVLVAGAVLPRRERTLALDSSDEGRIAARKRPLQSAVSTLAERPRGVTRTRARVRGRYRRAGGRLRVRAGRGPGAEPDALATQIRAEVAGLAEAFKLRAKVRTRRDEKGRRPR